MICPECDREVQGTKCRCGWKCPRVIKIAQQKVPLPETDPKVARENVANLKKLVGRVIKPLPYDKRRT